MTAPKKKPATKPKATEAAKPEAETVVVTEQTGPATNEKAKAIKAALSIKARSGTFRRCGFSFGKEATLIPSSDLSDEEINTLMSEPMLVCEWVGELPGESE